MLATVGVLVAVLAFIGFFNIKAYLHYWINETVSDKLGDYIEKNPEKITQFIKNNKDVSDFFYYISEYQIYRIT